MLLKLKCTFSVWVHYTRQGGWQSGSICMVWKLHSLPPAVDNYYQEQFQVAIRCHSFVHLPHLLLMRTACGGFLVSKLLMHHLQLFNWLLLYELLTTIFPNQQLKHSVGISGTSQLNWFHLHYLVHECLYQSAKLLLKPYLKYRQPASCSLHRIASDLDGANHSFHLWSTWHHGCVILLEWTRWTRGSLCPACRSTACDWVGHQGGTHFQCA